MCKMPSKTYFVLMRGNKSSLLPIVLGTSAGLAKVNPYTL